MEGFKDGSFAAAEHLDQNNFTMSETCTDKEEQAASLYPQMQEKRLENGEELQDKHEQLVAQQIDVREDRILEEDDLENMHLSTLREYDAEFLTLPLQIGTKMAARPKSKEEVIITSRNDRLDELKREQHQLDQEIANLLEIENHLNQQLQHEEPRENDKLVDEEKGLLDEIKCVDVDMSVLTGQEKEIEKANEKFIKENKAELNEILERIKQLKEEEVLLNKALEVKKKDAATNTLKQTEETHSSLTTKITQLEELGKKLQDEHDLFLFKAADDNKTKLAAFQHELNEGLEKILNGQQAYEREVNAKLDGITDILHQRQLDLRNTEMEAATKKRLLENELSTNKFTIYNSMTKNKENYDKIIEKLRINIEKVTEENNEKLKKIKDIRLIIQEKKRECENLQVTFNPIPVDNEKIVKQAGILKYPDKETPPKDVFRRVSTKSTLNSNSCLPDSKNINNENLVDLLDQFLLLTSDEEPPEKRPKLN